MAQVIDTHSAYRAANPQTKTSNTTLSFRPRLEGAEPKKDSTGWQFYTSTKDNGYFQAAQADCRKPKSKYGCTALYNCVNYALGRANEIHGSWKWNYPGPGNAWVWWDNVPSKWGWSRGSTPFVGAIMVFWKNNSDPTNHGPGHVAVVEKVESDGSIWMAESQWTESKEPWCWRCRHVYAPGYGYGNYYTFKGFLYHPDIPLTSNVKLVDPYTSSTSSSVDAVSSADPGLVEYNNKVIQQQTTVLANTYNDTRGMDLLSTSNLVEAPYIIVKIGDYTFGSYTKDGTLERANSTMRVTYPNYMKSITINKTNGVLNQYTLEMTYQIVPGKDPNLLDRVFSTISGTREITISYGDWNTFTAGAYKEEQAIVTKVTSKVDFASSSINYTLSCTSKALSAAAQTFPFDPVKGKSGSQIIDELLNNSKYGLKDIFPAMADDEFVKANKLIPWDDRAIEIEAQNMDTLKYLNYVVASMSANTNNDNSVIKDSTYHLVIMDDLDGLYFKIIKVGTSTRSIVSDNIYEVDIGYPTNTLVTGFDINTDNSWAILYNYADKIEMNKYVYSIDNNGNVRSDYVDATGAISAYNKRVTEINKTWWTKMTQFPITATLTIKGLLRPAILMNYVRINSYFYGQKHVSSGLYIITKQEDTINTSGYRTVLNLTRISGDDDETQSYSQTAVSKTTSTNVKTAADVEKESTTTNANWDTTYYGK